MFKSLIGLNMSNQWVVITKFYVLISMHLKMSFQMILLKLNFIKILN